MAFTSSIETHGLAREQLIYHVGLINSRLKPIRSSNKQFRNAVGNVAASKALLVYRSPWTFESVRVAIPAEELEVRAEDLPALAEFSLSRADGTVLAREVAVLPLYRATKGPLRRYVREDAGRKSARSSKTSREAPTPARSPRTAKSLAGDRSAPKGLFMLLAEALERWSHETESQAPVERPWQWPRVARAESLHGWLSDLLGDERPPPQSQPARKSPPAAARRQPAAALPDAQPTKETEPSYTRYVVRKGDTLSGIARRLLNDEARWIEIFQLNRDRLNSPRQMREGMVLRVPRAVREPEGQN